MIVYLFIVMSVAGFSYELAYGTLSENIKKLVRLEQPLKYHALTYMKTWKLAVGNIYLILTPVLILIVLARLLHMFLYKLLNCPYCSSVWVLFAINLWILNMSMETSIILSCTAIPIIALIDRLRI